MSIKVNIDSQFISKDKDASRDVKLELSAQTIGDCLGKFLLSKPDLKREFFAKTGELDKTTYVMVNQVPIFGDKLTRTLNDGDEVTFLYASQEP